MAFFCGMPPKAGWFFMQGLLHVYTGDGKGKTTAAVGLAVRMRGAGMPVVFAQFLKGTSTSELAPLQTMGVQIFRRKSVEKFVSAMTPEERAACRSEQCACFAQAAAAAPRAGLLVLDELCGALALDMVNAQAVRTFLKDRPAGLEIACTGRDAPEWLLEQADYVTVMVCKKHPYTRGIRARKGIEY